MLHATMYTCTQKHGKAAYLLKMQLVLPHAPSYLCTAVQIANANLQDWRNRMQVRLLYSSNVTCVASRMFVKHLACFVF